MSFNAINSIDLDKNLTTQLPSSEVSSLTSTNKKTPGKCPIAYSSTTSVCSYNSWNYKSGHSSQKPSISRDNELNYESRKSTHGMIIMCTNGLDESKSNNVLKDKNNNVDEIEYEPRKSISHAKAHSSSINRISNPKSTKTIQALQEKKRFKDKENIIGYENYIGSTQIRLNERSNSNIKQNYPLRDSLIEITQKKRAKQSKSVTKNRPHYKFWMNTDQVNPNRKPMYIIKGSSGQKTSSIPNDQFKKEYLRQCSTNPQIYATTTANLNYGSIPRLDNDDQDDDDNTIHPNKIQTTCNNSNSSSTNGIPIYQRFSNNIPFPQQQHYFHEDNSNKQTKNKEDLSIAATTTTKAATTTAVTTARQVLNSSIYEKLSKSTDLIIDSELIIPGNGSICNDNGNSSINNGDIGINNGDNGINNGDIGINNDEENFNFLGIDSNIDSNQETHLKYYLKGDKYMKQVQPSITPLEEYRKRAVGIKGLTRRSHNNLLKEFTFEASIDKQIKQNQESLYCHDANFMRKNSIDENKERASEKIISLKSSSNNVDENSLLDDNECGLFDKPVVYPDKRPRGRNGNVKSLKKSGEILGEALTLENAKYDESNTRHDESNMRRDKSNTRHDKSNTREYESNTKHNESNARHDESKTSDNKSNTRHDVSNRRHSQRNTSHYESNTIHDENNSSFECDKMPLTLEKTVVVVSEIDLDNDKQDQVQHQDQNQYQEQHRVQNVSLLNNTDDDEDKVKLTVSSKKDEVLSNSITNIESSRPLEEQEQRHQKQEQENNNKDDNDDDDSTLVEAKNNNKITSKPPLGKSIRFHKEIYYHKMNYLRSVDQTHMKKALNKRRNSKNHNLNESNLIEMEDIGCVLLSYPDPNGDDDSLNEKRYSEKINKVNDWFDEDEFDQCQQLLIEVNNNNDYRPDLINYMSIEDENKPQILNDHNENELNNTIVYTRETSKTRESSKSRDQIIKNESTQIISDNSRLNGEVDSITSYQRKTKPSKTTKDDTLVQNRPNTLQIPISKPVNISSYTSLCDNISYPSCSYSSSSKDRHVLSNVNDQKGLKSQGQKTKTATFNIKEELKKLDEGNYVDDDNDGKSKARDSCNYCNVF